MKTLKDSRSAMAEVLVRQVLGESESFERICAQRDVDLTGAVGQALRSWMSNGPTLVHTQTRKSEPPTLLLPDPAECPQGQEAEWLRLCDHDLSVLRVEQQRCIKSRDAAGLNSTNRSIEAYIQAVDELKERLKVA